jgi:serine/threonine-protein kinase
MGPYVLLHELAESSLCRTYRAGLKSGDDVERVVLLCLFRAGADDVGWISETATVGRRALQGLLSPHLADLVDSGEIDGTAFLAYDYVPGTTLSALLGAARAQRMPVPLGLSLLVVNRCAEGLLAAWRHESRMLHGFLVPPLVLLSNEGEVRVLGCEVASRLRRLLKHERVRGELAAYLAPEVVPEGQPATTDDVYSLGAILFELVTGSAPPRSEPELSRAVEAAATAGRGELPDEVRELLATSLVAPPRRSTLQDWAEAMREIVLSGRYETSSFDLAFFLNRLLGRDLDGDTDAPAEEATARTREEALATVRMRLEREEPQGPEHEPRGEAQDKEEGEEEAAAAQEQEAVEAEREATGPLETKRAGEAPDESLPPAAFARPAATRPPATAGPPLALPPDTVPDAASRKRALAIAASIVALILGGLGAAYYLTTDRSQSVAAVGDGGVSSPARPATRPAAPEATGAADPSRSLASPPAGESPATGPSVGAPAGPAAGSTSSADVERRVQELVSKRSATIEATLRDEYAQQIADLQAQLAAQQAADELQTAASAGPVDPETRAGSTSGEPAGAARPEAVGTEATLEQGAGQSSGATATRELASATGQPRPAGLGGAASSASSTLALPSEPAPASDTTASDGPGSERSDPPARQSTAERTAPPVGNARSEGAGTGAAAGGAEPEREPARKGDLVTPGPGVQSPTLRESVQPHYPLIARRLSKAAAITLRVLIDENGRVVEVEQLGEKAGYGFDEEAVDAAKRMVWNPAVKDGVAVKVWWTLRVAFKP